MKNYHEANVPVQQIENVEMQGNLTETEQQIEHSSADAQIIIDGQVFTKIVLPAFTREDAIKKTRGGENSLSMAGRTGPGTAPSRYLGTQHGNGVRIVQGPDAGKTFVEEYTYRGGAKRSAVIGDIQSRKSGL